MGIIDMIAGVGADTDLVGAYEQGVLDIDQRKKRTQDLALGEETLAIKKVDRRIAEETEDEEIALKEQEQKQRALDYQKAEFGFEQGKIHAEEENFTAAMVGAGEENWSERLDAYFNTYHPQKDVAQRNAYIMKHGLTATYGPKARAGMEALTSRVVNRRKMLQDKELMDREYTWKIKLAELEGKYKLQSKGFNFKGDLGNLISNAMKADKMGLDEVSRLFAEQANNIVGGKRMTVVTQMFEALDESIKRSFPNLLNATLMEEATEGFDTNSWDMMLELAQREYVDSGGNLQHMQTWLRRNFKMTIEDEKVYFYRRGEEEQADYDAMALARGKPNDDVAAWQEFFRYPELIEQTKATAERQRKREETGVKRRAGRIVKD
jgi:hypothetical protein